MLEQSLENFIYPKRKTFSCQRRRFLTYASGSLAVSSFLSSASLHYPPPERKEGAGGRKEMGGGGAGGWGGGKEVEGKKEGEPRVEIAGNFRVYINYIRLLYTCMQKAVSAGDTRS